MAFCTIHPAEGLSERDYRRALRAGPRAVATRKRSHRELLARAGFVDIDETDVTAEYRTTAMEMLARQAQFEDQLRRHEAGKTFEEKQEDLTRVVTAIDEGILRRSLFVAQRS